MFLEKYCGEIVKKTLSERTHQCSCGYVADRDVNAAINILNLALKNVVLLAYPFRYGLGLVCARDWILWFNVTYYADGNDS
ncbi:transposase [Paenibacillus sp. GP183]|uniref:transposase n=1 Tax=Paenibacillus sp. GP183 TaxID=1882751 RepID=UPI000A7CFA57|nr:transposase [Paenibacillus sp. GP183]